MAAPPPPPELPSGGAEAAALRDMSCVGMCSRCARRGAPLPRHALLTRLRRSDTPLVPPIELPTRLGALPLWRLGADGKSIEKSFVARNFVAGARAQPR